MDLELLHRSVYSIMVTIGLALGTTITPATPVVPTSHIQDSGFLQAYNLPSDSLDLEDSQVSYNLTNTEFSNKKVEEEQLLLVTVEPSPEPQEILEVATVVEVIKPPPAKKVEVKEEEVVKVEVETPAPITLGNAVSANAQKLFEMVNQHRISLGLTAFEKDNNVCSIAAARAPQVSDEVFKDGPMHKGFKALNLTYWATENIAAYSTIEQNFNFWIKDYIHRVAIEGDSKYSCVACEGTACSQIFTSYIPK